MPTSVRVCGGSRQRVRVRRGSNAILSHHDAYRYDYNYMTDDPRRSALPRIRVIRWPRVIRVLEYSCSGPRRVMASTRLITRVWARDLSSQLKSIGLGCILQESITRVHFERESALLVYWKNLWGSMAATVNYCYACGGNIIDLLFFCIFVFRSPQPFVQMERVKL